VLFSFGVAKAGELTITGNAKASYAIVSSDGTAAAADTAPGLGISNEFTLGASGELDNGYTWSYAIDIDAVESSATNDDAKLTLTTPQGTFGIFLGEGGLGVDNGGSQSVISRPSDTSYGEAMTDTFDIDGYDNIQYHTPADMLPYGMSIKVGYAPSGNATAANDFKATGSTPSATAAADTASSGGISVTAGGDSVTHYQVKATALPYLDGLTVGADYLEFSGVIDAGEQAPSSGAYYATYSMGPAVIGYSKSYLATALNQGIGDVTESIEGTKYSISFNVNDDLSVSYENEESNPDNTTQATANYTMESNGIQAAYTMGGMTIGIAMNEHENANYVNNKDVNDTVISLAMAF